jgi:hypothetical protein
MMKISRSITYLSITLLDGQQNLHPITLLDGHQKLDYDEYLVNIMIIELPCFLNHISN